MSGKNVDIYKNQVVYLVRCMLIKNKQVDIESTMKELFKNPE